MLKTSKVAIALAAVAGFALFSINPEPASAHGTDSGGGGGGSKCAKFKKGSKDWKECMGQHAMDREDAYALGYWLAKTGEFDEALAVLTSAGDENDPRVLTMIGYATRHLGRVDEAMGYYAKALALAPNMTNTRQYLGEAFLQKGEPVRAREQLAEIATRCGEACEDYRSLAREITAFENSAL